MQELNIALQWKLICVIFREFSLQFFDAMTYLHDGHLECAINAIMVIGSGGFYTWRHNTTFKH